MLLARYKKEILACIFLAIAYFVIRLIGLTNIPIFTDEAIYLRWAQIALNDSNWRFISLTDGKQPMFIWMVMIFQKFIEDPLVAGRITSVLSGFFTLIGLLLLSYELFKNKTLSFFTGLLYIVYPFAQVYDRMALMDGAVGTFAVWGLLFGVYLVRRIRLDVAYTLGFIIGGAALTKSNGFFSIYLLPFTLLLFDFKQKKVLNRFIKWGALAAFVFILSQGIYFVLRLSPFFYIVAEKNNVFIYTFQEWITHPILFLTSNLSQEFMSLIAYTFPIYIVLILIGFVNRKFVKENLLLLIYFALPFIALGFFGKIIYPRYIYPMTLSLIPIAGLGIYMIFDRLKKLNKHDYLPVVVVILLLAYPCFRSFQIAYDPTNALLAQADKDQYISGWPAGWGVKEANSFLQDKSKKEKIALYTQGTFGLMPYSIELYQQHNPNLKIVALWPIGDTPPEDALASAKIMPTYVLFYQPCPSCLNTNSPPKGWNVAKVLQAPAGDLAIYQLLSK